MFPSPETVRLVVDAVPATVRPPVEIATPFWKVAPAVKVDVALTDSLSPEVSPRKISPVAPIFT